MYVEPPTPEKKARGRRLYNYCLLTALVPCSAWLALMYVVNFHPKDQNLQNLVGITAISLGGVWLLIYAVLSLMGAAIYVDVGSYTLPYRLKISPTFLWGNGVLLAVMTYLLSPRLLYSNSHAVPFAQKLHVDALTLLLYFLLFPLPLGLAVFFCCWRSVTIYEDHLVFTALWRKRQIFFYDIYRFGAFVPNKKRCILVIRYQGDDDKPFEFNLSVFGFRDIAILMNEIDEKAPQASINYLAQQLKYGDFTGT